jgi:5-methylcytosine-specific restriction enzyme subunit McrC
MLYQLAVYDLGHNQTERRAAIIYPSSNPQAREQSITIQEAVKGAPQARVDLRPVNLLFLNKLLQEGHDLEPRRRKVKFARQLAFGQIVNYNPRFSQGVQTSGSAFPIAFRNKQPLLPE